MDSLRLEFLIKLPTYIKSVSKNLIPALKGAMFLFLCSEVEPHTTSPLHLVVEPEISSTISISSTVPGVIFLKIDILIRKKKK